MITMKSLAALEAGLIDKKNCILVPPSNPEKLAEGILFLKNNSKKCKEIAEEGNKNYYENLSMNISGKKLLSFIQEIVRSKV